MKKIFFLLTITFLVSSCSSINSNMITSNISIEKLKTDLIGTEVGDLDFKAPSEFIDAKIIQQKKTGELLELDAEFILRGIYFHPNRLSEYLKAKFTYRKENGDWKLITSYMLKFRKSYNGEKLE